ncbi:MAG: hypothetical protein AAB304_02370 [Pseudomonadota bacterium]
MTALIVADKKTARDKKKYKKQAYKKDISATPAAPATPAEPAKKSHRFVPQYRQSALRSALFYLLTDW